MVPPPDVPPGIAAWDLGPGESAVLAWAAARPGTIAVIDDLAARRCAAAPRSRFKGRSGWCSSRSDAARSLLRDP